MIEKQIQNMWCLQDKTNAKIWMSQVFIEAYVCF